MTAPWTAARRAKFRATMAAKAARTRAERAGKAPTPPPDLRCDMCDIPAGEPSFRGPAKVLRFWLIRPSYRSDGRQTTRGAGALNLCQRCWETTAGRRRNPNVRSDGLSAHKFSSAAAHARIRPLQPRSGLDTGGARE